jgi:hypothetical protein
LAGPDYRRHRPRGLKPGREPADTPGAMGSITTALVWLALAGLGFLLITCCLYSLAVEKAKCLDLHDLIIDSKRLRQQYYRALAARRRNIHYEDPTV